MVGEEEDEGEGTSMLSAHSDIITAVILVSHEIGGEEWNGLLEVRKYPGSPEPLKIDFA